MSLLIVECLDGKYALISRETPFTERWGETIRIEINAKRLVKLGQDILDHFDKKTKFAEWTPNIDDFKIKLNEVWGQDAFSTWLIDWIRGAYTMKQEREVKQARLFYEWLKSNERILYGENE